MKEAIDNKELVIALEELEKEKGIKKDYVIESIETALVTAYKKNFDSADNVKVVILGQDPYHGENEAHGLSFSVLDGVKRPPSLNNIFKEKCWLIEED